jgi:hypothetical protein
MFGLQMQLWLGDRWRSMTDEQKQTWTAPYEKALAKHKWIVETVRKGRGNVRK